MCIIFMLNELGLTFNEVRTIEAQYYSISMCYLDIDQRISLNVFSWYNKFFTFAFPHSASAARAAVALCTAIMGLVNKEAVNYEVDKVHDHTFILGAEVGLFVTLLRLSNLNVIGYLFILKNLYLFNILPPSQNIVPISILGVKF